MKSTIQYFHRKCKLLLAAAALAVAFSGVVQTGTASASPGSCAWLGYWQCQWYNTSLAPNTADWFEAGTNLRNWYAASINGYYHDGYTVTQKCVHVVKGSNGEQGQVACGWGAQSGAIGAAWQPGYLFLRHGAAGARSMLGHGYH